MNIDSFTISRYIFLGFIIFISVYFIIENKKVKPIERFVDAKAVDNAKASGQLQNAPAGGAMEALDKKNKEAQNPKEPLPDKKDEYISKDEAEVQKVIIDIYQELYKTPPSSEELAFYTEYAQSRNITKEKLKEIIETSAPTLQKTFYSKKYANTPDEIFGMENEIIEVYNELLMRNPDRQELYSFAKMMSEDNTLTLDKLRQILIASEEFKRMEKTQNNKVYVNLQSNITDRQLTIQVTKLYSQVTGKDYVDEDTLKFLKRKFVEFELNEKVMLKFIQSYMSGLPFVVTEEDLNIKKANTLEEDKKTNKLDQSQLDEMKKKLIAELEAARKAEAEAAAKKGKDGDKSKEKFQDGKNIFNDAKLYFFSGEGVNDDVLASIVANGGVNKDGSIDTSKLINNIKDNSTCAYSKNQFEIDLLAKNKQELSDYINDRNMSHLKNVCTRNKKFINADENMVLYPEFKWSVPQKHPPVCTGSTNSVNPMVDQTALIGTLLPDAKDTQVGSILPVFPPV